MPAWNEAPYGEYPRVTPSPLLHRHDVRDASATYQMVRYPHWVVDDQAPSRAEYVEDINRLMAALKLAGAEIQQLRVENAALLEKVKKVRRWL